MFFFSSTEINETHITSKIITLTATWHWDRTFLGMIPTQHNPWEQRSQMKWTAPEGEARGKPLWTSSYSQGIRRERNRGTVAELCLHRNMARQAVTLDGWGSVLGMFTSLMLENRAGVSWVTDSLCSNVSAFTHVQILTVDHLKKIYLEI